MTSDERFGDALRSRREAANLSLGGLAALTHYSKGCLSRVENGHLPAVRELALRCDVALDAEGELTALAPQPEPPEPPEPPGVTCPPRPPAQRQPGLAEASLAEAGRSPEYGAEFDRLIRSGDARYAAGEMREAGGWYLAAYRTAAGDARARAFAIVRHARRWSDPGQADRELPHLLRGCLAALEGDESPAADGLRLQLGAHLARKLSTAVGEDAAAPWAGPERGAQRAGRTLRELRGLPPGRRLSLSEEARCEVLTECRWGLYDFAPAGDLLAVSEELQDAASRARSAHFHGEALVALAVDQLRVGRVNSAFATVERHRAHAARRRSALTTWQQSTLDTLLDLWRGRFEEAADWIFGESRAIVERLEADLTVPVDTLRRTRLGQAYWLLREQGRTAELFDSGVADGVERHGCFPVWRAGLILALCETARYDRALDHLAAFAQDTRGFTVLPPHGWSVPTAALLAEAYAILERTDAYGLQLLRPAAELRERLAGHASELVLAGRPTVLLGPAARASGLLSLAGNDPAQALHHFWHATRLARSSPPHMVRLRLDEARAHLRTGTPGARRAAVGLLNTARRSAEGLGMAGVARECGGLLTAAG
ncbi:helix-turn-helix domain-containing protein [Streptomyces sp. NPDC050617]|uniref:helix-turn-helix domain-containing protein n=1 Tax=Streptomyces sp. NPDC050617 TaxID=3154628 RepID=UPI00341CE5E7